MEPLRVQHREINICRLPPVVRVEKESRVVEVGGGCDLRVPWEVDNGYGGRYIGSSGGDSRVIGGDNDCVSGSRFTGWM